MFDKWKAGDPVFSAIPTSLSDAEARKFFAMTVRDSMGEIYLNDVYQVHLRRQKEIVHLSIKRIDRQPIHDWRDLQEIKNQLLGEETEAVELYPAESRRVDAANQYHLWAITKPCFRFPFGFPDRLVTEASLGKSVNRPFERTP